MPVPHPIHPARSLITTAAFVLGGAVLVAPSTASAGKFLDDQLKKPRVAAAMRARGPAVAQAFRKAGAAWPARGLFIRAFKLEATVELWAPARARPGRRGKRWVKVMTVPVCANSGALGPKRRRGDGQVPEGFYRVDRFNPWSRFHLSLGLNYPNRDDRRAGGKGPLGGDIFIHGNCVTIGCLPLTDAKVRDVYLAAIHAYDQSGKYPQVHIFPCRFGTAKCEFTLAKQPALSSWWNRLRPGYRAFERNRIPRRSTTVPKRR